MRKACVLALVALMAMCAAASFAAEKTYKPTWDSLQKHNEAPEWFRDAKFGIYFHWGVYSVPAFGSEWYPRNMHRKNRPEYTHHLETYGEPTEFGYHEFVPGFKAQKFDAERWATLFEKAGARFAGPVAEHHDGFAMWDSEVTPWNAADKGPKKDLTGLLEEAIRERGMKFFASFHHARNNLWQKPNGDWTGHYEFVKKDFPALLEDPENAILYGYMPRDEFLDFWLAKLQEVIDRYHPDVMWFDSWLDEIPEEYQRKYLAYYFNHAKPGQQVVVTRKQDDLPLDVSVEDFEKGRANRLTENVWLTDDTISRGSWCYTKGLKIKSLDEVLDTFIDIVSKNGVLVLNISPKANGIIPENQKKVLLGIGEWLDKYGEAIYNTRPYLVFGEGPTRLKKGGHFVRMKGGYKPEDIRFTRSKDGKTVYAIELGWPGNNKTVTIESVSKDMLPDGVKVTDVSLMGYDAEIDWKMTGEGLQVTTPDTKVDELAVVYRIKTNGSVMAGQK